MSPFFLAFHVQGRGKERGGGKERKEKKVRYKIRSWIFFFFVNSGPRFVDSCVTYYIISRFNSRVCKLSVRREDKSLPIQYSFNPRLILRGKDSSLIERKKERRKERKKERFITSRATNTHYD